MLRTRLSFALLFLAALAGTTHADEDTPTETAGRWLGGANEGVQAFGKVGDQLVSVTAKSFVGAGTGGDKRALAQGWNSAMQAWKGSAEATKNSLPYSVAPAAFAVSDIATSVVAPAMEGDGSGAVSGAVNMGVSSLATAEGAAVGAKIFAVAGGAIGSFFPVVGTAAGTVVGGAIGSVAGGFITSIAYDRYGKSIIGNVISAFTETDSLQQAYDARDEFLRKQAAPELAKNWNYNLSVSASFGEEEQQLQKHLSISRIQIKPQPEVDGDLLNGATRFAIAFWTPNSPVNWHYSATCDVKSTKVACNGGVRDATSVATWKLSGDMVLNGFSGATLLILMTTTPGCSSTIEFRGTDKFTLLPQGRFAHQGSAGHAHYTSMTGCNGAKPTDYDYPGTNVIGNWQVQP